MNNEKLKLKKISHSNKLRARRFIRARFARSIEITSVTICKVYSTYEPTKKSVAQIQRQIHLYEKKNIRSEIEI
jgi:hypothetical protein